MASKNPLSQYSGQVEEVRAADNLSVTSQVIPPLAVAYAATITPDMSLANTFEVGVLTGNITVGVPLNLNPGQAGWIMLEENGAGGWTIAFASIWKFKNKTTPSAVTTAGAKNRLDYTIISATEIDAALDVDVG